jgi:hypothetical protein
MDENSPSVRVEALQHSIRIFYILLRFLPHVENGAIFAGAQYVLHIVSSALNQIKE